MIRSDTVAELNGDQNDSLTTLRQAIYAVGTKVTCSLDDVRVALLRVAPANFLPLIALKTERPALRFNADLEVQARHGQGIKPLSKLNTYYFVDMWVACRVRTR